jgi:predicted hotdog family 3-hydroxylacyl-ACP dehydratase
VAKIKRPIRAEEVVPHQPPMSLLDVVVAHDAETTVCDVRITPQSPFFEKGRIAAWVGLEYMAQTVAAHAGMISRRKGQPPEIGFWLGTRRADFHTRGFRAGQRLRVRARRTWGEGDMFSFDCMITDAGSRKCLVSAQLNVFRPGPQNLNRILKEVNR